MLIGLSVLHAAVEKRRPRTHHSDHCQATRFPMTETSATAAQPPITLYTSAVCAYCVAAKNFLRSRGLSWDEVRVDLDPAERERMVARARRTSVPQIFVGEVHVGGYDDMMALQRAGKLDALLAGTAP
jgi:glutaredoxin 3